MNQDKKQSKSRQDTTLKKPPVPTFKKPSYKDGSNSPKNYVVKFQRPLTTKSTSDKAINLWQPLDTEPVPISTISLDVQQQPREMQQYNITARAQTESNTSKKLYLNKNLSKPLITEQKRDLELIKPNSVMIQQVQSEKSETSTETSISPIKYQSVGSNFKDISPEKVVKPEKLLSRIKSPRAQTVLIQPAEIKFALDKDLNEYHIQHSRKTSLKQDSAHKNLLTDRKVLEVQYTLCGDKLIKDKELDTSLNQQLSKEDKVIEYNLSTDGEEKLNIKGPKSQTYISLLPQKLVYTGKQFRGENQYKSLHEMSHNQIASKSTCQIILKPETAANSPLTNRQEISPPKQYKDKKIQVIALDTKPSMSNKGITLMNNRQIKERNRHQGDVMQNQSPFGIKSSAPHFFINTTVNLNNNLKQKPQNDPSKSIDTYVFEKVIGSGSYAVVRVAKDDITQQQFAVKTYDKYKLFDSNRRRNVRSEIAILSALSHENLISLEKTIETPTQIHLIMEYIGHTSLYDYQKTKPNRRFTEDEGRMIFTQIASGIAYCHRRSVVHRDIKLENILIDQQQQNVKIIDFGFSTVCKRKELLNLFCGTPSYMAPELVLKKDYSGQPADVWALGVLLYVIIGGKFPFRSNDEKELYRKIIKLQYDAPVDFSIELQTLIGKIFKMNPNERITMEEIMQDNWILNKNQQNKDKDIEEINNNEKQILYTEDDFKKINIEDDEIIVLKEQTKIKQQEELKKGTEP